MITMPTVDQELTRLNRALGLYRQAAKMSVAAVLQKKGAQLGYALWTAFRGLMPEKGSIRVERLAALKAGEGIRVRPAAREWAEGKFGATDLQGASVRARRARGGAVRLDRTIQFEGERLNVSQLAVRRELNIRESGRGFTGQSARYRFGQVGDAGRGDVADYQRAMSRYGPVLSTFDVRFSERQGRAEFRWGGFSKLSSDAVQAIGRTRGMAAVAEAMRAVTDDMVPYLESHLQSSAASMGLTA